MDFCFVSDSRSWVQTVLGETLEIDPMSYYAVFFALTLFGSMHKRHLSLICRSPKDLRSSEVEV